MKEFRIELWKIIERYALSIGKKPEDLNEEELVAALSVESYGDEGN